MKAQFVFAKTDDPDSPDLIFVEVENMQGEIIAVGKWLLRDDGYYVLVVDLGAGMIIKKTDDGVEISPTPPGKLPDPPEGYRLLERGVDVWEETDLVYDDLMEIWHKIEPAIFQIGNLFSDPWPKYPPARRIEE